MRLKSEIWVHAYLRRSAASGAFAAVVRHGDDDAGAIYIKVTPLDGTAALYGPVPAGLTGGDGDRQWTVHLPAGTAEAMVEAHLARQHTFDPDLWVIEVEDRLSRHFLDGWLG
jgi:hypothetical protein